MRKQFIQTTTSKLAKAEAPWACKIVKVCGGYMAFESLDDYRTWQRQL